MEDALSASLGRVTSLASTLGGSPTPPQLEQLRTACASAVAAAGRPAGPLQQKQLWDVAAGLWNASIEFDLSGSDGDGAADDGSRRAVAALCQAACDLCAPLATVALLPPEQASLVRFHYKAGQCWAALREYEAAEAALSRGSERAQALLPLCFERRGRGAPHQDAAALLLGLLLERLQVALELGQEMLSTGLVSQSRTFAADERLPAGERLAFQLELIHVLRMQGQRLVQAGQPGTAALLLTAAYDVLSQLELEDPAGVPEGGTAGELAATAAEARASGAQVLTLLAWCNLEAGQAEQALSCLQALQQVAADVPGAATHFSTAFLLLRILLHTSRLGEAQTALMDLVSHEEATSEACLAGLKACLAVPNGVPLARSALGLVLERFAEEPGVAVELVRAALAQAQSAGSGAVADGAATEQGEGSSSSGAAEALVLELAADERLQEGVCEEPALRRQLAGLLWNHATQLMGSRGSFAAALAFYSAVLPLLEKGGRDDAAMKAEAAETCDADAASGLPGRVECHRAQALCCLGAQQYDQALQFVAAAEHLQPGSVPTAMLRLTAHLAAHDAAGTTEAVAQLAACAAAQPDALRIACCACLDAGAQGAAQAALEHLLAQCAAATAPPVAPAEGGAGTAAAGAAAVLRVPGYEATLFQNLVKLLMDSASAAQSAAVEQQEEDAGSADNASHSSKLASLFDQVVQRMRAVGPESFFARQESGKSPQLEWFALQAWNAGQQAGTKGELQQAAVLLAVCGELYGVLPAPNTAALHKQKMAFLMAGASACEVHESLLAAAGRGAGREGAGAGNGAASAAASSLILARSHLGEARHVAGLLQARQALEGPSGAAAGADAKSDVYLTLLDFKLCWLAGDRSTQLQALEHCKALPAFGAEHFAMVAALARGGGSGSASGTGQLQAAAQGRVSRESAEVCRAAEAARLERLTQQAQLDYAAVAAALRALLELSTSDADRLQLFEEAAGLLSAAPPRAFPEQELRWLVTTAWNRGAVHARFGRTAEAARYQRWAVDALQYNASFASQYQELMTAELARTAQEGQRCGAATIGTEVA